MFEFTGEDAVAFGLGKWLMAVPPRFTAMLGRVEDRAVSSGRNDVRKMCELLSEIA